ncbi:hypothetical protein FQV27_18060 [Paracoccus aurantiacus]|uniref:Uncharacterized protein n=1 Tax=Paracoccus aurantiacus TaxID=2599412 RepID=A0A5C6RPM5_9RHOB|nr:hypothetical protein [Paracoccus aurantiacus]TXB64077.1 hypothetical protein FQV27_18060 [Paracoccus aurantiacus]
MVFDEAGELRPCDKAYDRKVAGVISGAGSYRPALILDQRDTGRPRLPIALMGKVYCLVDAAFGPISVGDMLTTSPTAGAAMVAADPEQAFGCVIGKALAPHVEGVGMIPIFVSMR